MFKQPSFFNCINLPYYIYAPDFTQKSAGIRALHYFCHALNEMGREAYLVGTDKDSETLRTPLLTSKDIIRHVKSGLMPIMVYPEVVTGNPLNMPFVVRWWLNKPGHLGGDETAAADEMVFTYSDGFVPDGMQVDLLNIPLIDKNLFNNENNPHDQQRSGACFYANKFLAKGGELTAHADEATSLCQDRSLTHAEIADILRRSAVLYCYEPTALIGEALLCGCPVVMIDSTFLKQNMREPIHGPGIAYSSEPDAIEKARAGISEVIYNNQTSINYCWWQVDQFLRKTGAEFEQRLESHDWHDKAWLSRLAQLISAREPDPEPLFRALQVYDYRWQQQHSLTESRVTVMAERLATWQQQPSFHLIMIVNGHELDRLGQTLSSLDQQLYSAWGLTILSDVAAPDVFSDVPDNIEWLQLNSSLNEAIDSAVGNAGLDWIMQLLPGDSLPPHALLSFAQAINLEPDKHFIYCDEHQSGADRELHFKPDFSLDYLRACSYLGRGIMVSRAAFEAVGGYTRFAYVQVTDLAFKIYEQFGESAFAHIPDLLYFASAIEQDAATLTENEWLIRHGHFNRLDLPVTISHPEGKNRFKTSFKASAQPLVSILVAHRNQASQLALCLEEIVANTVYPNYEIVVVDVASEVEDLEDIYAQQSQLLGEQFQLIHFEQPDYAAAINAAAGCANGQTLVLLSCFARTVNGNWLSEMLPLLQRDDVAVVGARIITDNNKVVHAGGVNGCCDDVNGLYAGEDISEPGYFERAHCIQEYAFVASACLMVAKEDFQYVGGLTTGQLSHSRYLINDFCLKQSAGRGRVLWTPYATVFQDIRQARDNNGVTAYQAIDQAALITRWPEAFAHDAFHNPNLRLTALQPEPETEIVCHWDRRIKDKLRLLALPLNSSAVGEYRLKAPLRALAEAGRLELCWLPDHEKREQPRLPSLFELHQLQPDVLYVQQALSDTMYDFLQRVRQQTSIKIVFSLDDRVTELPPMSDRRKQVFRDMRSRLRRTLALCDRVIVTTQPLAEMCQRYCDDVMIIPNRLEQRWLSLQSMPRTEDTRPRVGWAGAWQHSGDLALMTKVVKSLADRVDWVFMGMCPQDIRPYVKEFHPFVSFEKYPETLASLDLDLALAPLEQHPFNEAKSNLRLLEYGVLGWPVIASNVYPYQQFNAPVTLVENDEALWIEAIVAALAKPEKIAAQGRQLQDWVHQHFILEQHLEDWVEGFNFI
jgi:glycosyltransferase involved in cell wall biosynthesis